MWGAITPRTSGAGPCPRLTGARPVDRPGAVGRREESVEHPAKLARLARVRSAGVSGGTSGRREIVGVDDGAPVGEAQAVEESLLVERLGDLLDLPPLDEPAVTVHHSFLDVGNRVLAVEE